MFGVSVQVFFEVSLLGLVALDDELRFEGFALLLHHLDQFGLRFDLLLQGHPLHSFTLELCSDFNLTFFHSLLDDLHFLLVRSDQMFSKNLLINSGTRFDEAVHGTAVESVVGGRCQGEGDCAVVVGSRGPVAIRPRHLEWIPGQVVHSALLSALTTGFLEDSFLRYHHSLWLIWLRSLFAYFDAPLAPFHSADAALEHDVWQVFRSFHLSRDGDIAQ